MLDERLEQLYRNIEDQIRKEKERAKLRTPDGDRRIRPGTPPHGMEERREGIERRNRTRSPRAKEGGDK